MATDKIVRSPDLPRQFARTHRFALGVPGRFTVSPDGERVLYVRTGAGTDGVGRLWIHEDGAERVLADPDALGRRSEGAGDDGVAEDEGVPEEERIRRERARTTASGVVDYATDRHARVAVFTLGGCLWTVRTDGTVPRRIPTAGPAVDPRPSPDGSLVAYVTGGTLRVVRMDGTRDRPLAAPEGPDVTYGLSDHVSAESIGRLRGHWWSPDGDALLVARVDQARVARWYLTDPADPAKPPRAIRYPAAGTANPEVSLHILRLDGRRIAVRLPERAAADRHPPGEWTDPRYEYVTAAGWDRHGPFAQVQTRDQRTAALLAVDPDGGGTRPLHEETDPAWVALVPGTPGRTGGGTPVLAHLEDGDTRGLRIGGPEGGVATPAGLHVRAVVGTAGERVVFTASEDPTETHVWSYAPEEGFRRVSREPGVHTAAVGGDTLVLASRTARGRSVTVLRGAEPVGTIAVLAERPVVTPRPVPLSLGERELRSHLHLPSWHRPGDGRLPVLLSPYGGYGTQLAVRAPGWWSAVAQWFAEQGFAVLITDGRGTPGRGRAWETAIHGDRLTAPLDDQVDALRAAEGRYPQLDLDRVAIRGWSYGGYLAVGAVLHRPEVFRAAVAGGAPTDRRLYDTHWEERFLGHPGVHPDRYERSSLVPYAHRLTRPLMLMHGLADDNVVAAHTLRFSTALLAAGRPHTVLPLPGATHMVTRADVASNQLLLELDFLKRALAG
ncbi:S9 family peptidase [Streptomyces sp. SP18CS02]|uniref:S9 family peptidase n=1 Tax=Streptomyces sp. SP18CS02 TaxID=3002531 RepID=UPI002E7856AE|nr:prolyl oligopeptidase family serine peptidase [Streptomyces sp. SP18CS02]MEE1755502.1 prolyl oligopeptidase family serine peptidase [Streptomyces sp. SP18CS02]